MSRRTLSIALLAAVALSTVVIAHEGHHHTAMGTIEAIDEEQISLAMEGDKTGSFKLTDETTFTRGDDEVAREEATTGERAAVVYETKDKVNVAIEVKLPPKADR